MPAMTAVYFVNVLRLLIIRVPRVPGANINEVPNSEEFSHSAGGPQLELRWGPGRAKRARARHTFTKTRKTAKSHLFSELGEMLGNTGKKRKKKGGIYPNDLLELRFTTFQVLFIVSCLQYMRTCPANGGEMPRQRGGESSEWVFFLEKFFFPGEKFWIQFLKIFQKNPDLGYGLFFLW